MTENIKELRELLKFWHIPEDFEIEEEAEEMLLNALKQDGINNVFIDEEGGLVIDYEG